MFFRLLNCTILSLTSEMLTRPNLKDTDLTQKQTWAWNLKMDYSRNMLFGLIWFHVFDLLISIHIMRIFQVPRSKFHWIKQGPEGLVASAPASPAVAVAGCVQCGGVGVPATSTAPPPPPNRSLEETCDLGVAPSRYASDPRIITSLVWDTHLNLCLPLLLGGGHTQHGISKTLGK